MLSGEEIRFSTFSFSTKTRFHMILDMHHINLNKFVKGKSGRKMKDVCVVHSLWVYGLESMVKFSDQYFCPLL